MSPVSFDPASQGGREFTGERFWLSDTQWAAVEPLLPHLGQVLRETYGHHHPGLRRNAATRIGQKRKE